MRTGLSEKTPIVVSEIDDEPIQLLTPEGVRIESVEYDSWVEDLTDDDLVATYRDMVVVRRFDNEATALQRQGQLGLWPPSLGQEAAQIGSARALRADDFVFSSYREHGVAYVRGVRLEDMTRVWRGTANSGWDPCSADRLAWGSRSSASTR